MTTYYVAEDGTWGDADGLFTFEEPEDEHWQDNIEAVVDWKRPMFVEWFIKNPHADASGDDPWCATCDAWETPTP